MRDLDWRILAELHRNPNMTQVAKLLYVTQPTLTKRLQRIEEEMGVSVVDRTPKGLVFTPEGTYLAQRAEQYLIFRREVDEQLRQMKESGTQTLVIGSAYTFSKYNLRALLDPFSEDHPQLRWRVINRQSDMLYSMLLCGELDAAFVRDDYGEEMNRVRLQDTFGYIVGRREIRAEDLPFMRRITYQTNGRTTAILDDWWREWFGETPCRVGSSAGYVDFAMSTIVSEEDYLLCFLPEGAQIPEGLCTTPMRTKDGRAVSRSTWFLYDGRKRRSELMEEFIRYIGRSGRKP